MKATKTVVSFNTVYECVNYIRTQHAKENNILRWTKEQEQQLIKCGLYSGSDYVVFYDPDGLLD